MIAEGTFPFRQDDDEFEDAPRVGDGVIVLDPDLRVRFASPNAVSSMHRMGIHSYASGVQLVDMGFDQHAAAAALPHAPARHRGDRARRHVAPRAGDPVSRRRRDRRRRWCSLRDVTDLRRRDRMLLSKDATIREIHHRVKNNLQTIAALLRLQGRRLESPRGAGGPRGVGTAHPRRSRSCTRRCRGTPATSCSSTTSCEPLVRVVRGDRRRLPTPTCASRWSATPACCPATSRRRSRWCSTS